MRKNSFLVILAFLCINLITSAKVLAQNFLAPQGSKEASVSHYGLSGGLNAILAGRQDNAFIDWSDPPMDSPFDTITIDQTSLDNDTMVGVYTQGFIPSSPGRHKAAGRAHKFLGWLWVETKGVHSLRFVTPTSYGRVRIGGELLLSHTPQTSVVSATKTLSRGFYLFELDGFIGYWGGSHSVEIQRAGDSQYRALTPGDLYRGLFIKEDPFIYKVGAVGSSFLHPVTITGGVAPYQLSVVAGQLPDGLSLNSSNAISGQPSKEGFFRFTLQATDSRGTAYQSPHGIRIFPAPSVVDRNDRDMLFLGFEELDATTFNGGLVTGKATSNGADYVNISPGQYVIRSGNGNKTWTVKSGGAFGSSKYIEQSAGTDLRFYITGEQTQLMSDYMPALRKGNRFAVAFRLPPTMENVNRPDLGVMNCHQEPKKCIVVGHFQNHMAGHNVQRWVDFESRYPHQKEQENAHYYHPATSYWPSQWRATNLYNLGDGWVYAITSDQVANQRGGSQGYQGAGFYNPVQHWGETYLHTMNRIYFAHDEGWGATSNRYSEKAFGFDNMSFYHVDDGVDIKHTSGSDFARYATLPAAEIEVSFTVTHNAGTMASYYVSRWNGNVPKFDGTGIFLDENQNGRIDPGETELGLETPEFQPGETKHFVYRLTGGSVGETRFGGVNLRVRDYSDPLSLRGDSMMIIVHFSNDPGSVPLRNLRPSHANVVGPIEPNEPPIAEILKVNNQNVDRVYVSVNDTVSFEGRVDDVDGPTYPWAYWDFGDYSEILYGNEVNYAYSEQGRYLVTLHATDARSVEKDQVEVCVNLNQAACDAFDSGNEAIAPRIAPNGGSFAGPVIVTLSSNTPGAEIRYTTDGSLPTSQSLLYNGPFTLPITATIKSIALKSGLKSSSISSATFSVQAPDTIAPGAPRNLRAN